MYMIEYFKTDGDVITLTVGTDSELQNIVNSLTNRIIDGHIYSFNVEVLS